VAGLRREIYRDCKFVSSNKTQIEKLFVLIKELKEEVLLLQQGKEEAARRAALAENQAKAARNAADATAKEIHFLSEQVKRLAADKLRLEKRVGELERAGFSSPGNRSNAVTTMNHSRSPLPRVTEQEKSMTLLEESRSNISEIEGRVNELNYAKFMA
jgi:chromosome segregation ATPase